MQSGSPAIFALGVFLLVTTVTSQPLEGAKRKHRDKKMTDSDSYPFIVSLQRNDLCKYRPDLCVGKTKDGFLHMCSGSLIGESWVLTTAFCVLFYKEEDFPHLRVVLGNNHLLEHSTTEVYRGVQDIIMYPEFDNRTRRNDIALIKLSEPVVENNHIRFANLSQNDDGFNNNKCVFAGWGYHSFDVLKEVQLDFVSFDPCWIRNIMYAIQDSYERNKKSFTEILKNSGPRLAWFLLVDTLNVSYHQIKGMMNETPMCAVHTTPSDTADNGRCEREHGSPMMCGEEPKVLTGLLSWGFNCNKSPTIYTRVSAYTSWITKHTGIGEKLLK